MGIFNFIAEAGESLAEAIGLKSPEAADNIKHKIEQHDLGVRDLSVAVNEDLVTLGGVAPTQEVAEKAILTVGNIEGVARVDSQLQIEQAAAAESQAKFYTVKSGDTLSKIAQEFYGSAGRYNEIFDANRPMLGHPDKIYPGQTLRIPNA